MVNESFHLSKGDSVFIREEEIKLATENEVEVVLFVTNTKSPYYDGGMYSGSKI